MLIIGLLRTEAKLRLTDGLIQHVDTCLSPDRCRGLALHGVKSCDGFIVCSIRTSRTVINVNCVGDHPYRARHVVDHGDVGGQCQHGLRLSGFVRGFGTQGRFPMTNGIPTDSTYQTAGKVRQTVDMRSFQSLQCGMRHLDHVAFHGDSRRDLAQPVGLAAVGTQLSHGVDANEAIAAPGPSEFSRFEDEGAGTASRQTLIEANRSQ